MSRAFLGVPNKIDMSTDEVAGSDYRPYFLLQKVRATRAWYGHLIKFVLFLL